MSKKIEPKTLASFVFTARGDIREFAYIVSVLEEDYKHIPSSRGEVISLSLQILSTYFKTENRGTPMPTIADAKRYLGSVGLGSVDIRKKVPERILKEEAERVNKLLQERGKDIREELTAIEKLNKARKEVKGDDQNS